MNKNEFETRIKVLELELSSLKSDLTEARKSGEALRNSEEIMRYIIKHDPNAIAVYDRSLHYIFVSDRYLHDYNVREKDIIGKHHYEVFPEMPQIWKDVHRRCLAGAIEKNDNDLFVRTDGSITYNKWECRPWYLVNHEIGGIVTYTEVTTDRKLAELALRESESSLRDAQKIAKMGSWEWDLVTQKLKWSDNYFAILGYKPSEVEPGFEFIKNRLHPDDVPGLEELLAKLLKDKTPAGNEVRLIQSDGSVKWIQNNIFPVIVNNSISKLKGTSLDITERKSGEQTIKESERKLFQLNADKDLFISILSHDLKSHFNNLLGFSEVLTEDVRKLNIDEIEIIANNIYKTARNTYNLLEDILVWARAQSGKVPFNPQNLNLTDLFKNIIEVLYPNAKLKNIVMSCLTTDQLNVFADIDMLKTILRNLVSNAIKFTNKGGAIKINAEVNPGNVTISVSDDGIGIDPDHLTKLFDISQVMTTTGTAKETGTGLGLLLCKEFTEKHGGKIWVESVYGKGSDFKFTLPTFTKHAV